MSAYAYTEEQLVELLAFDVFSALGLATPPALSFRRMRDRLLSRLLSGQVGLEIG